MSDVLTFDMPLSSPPPTRRTTDAPRCGAAYSSATSALPMAHAAGGSADMCRRSALRHVSRRGNRSRSCRLALALRRCGVSDQNRGEVPPANRASPVAIRRDGERQ